MLVIGNIKELWGGVLLSWRLVDKFESKR
jgi:hypothetical protein